VIVLATSPLKYRIWLSDALYLIKVTYGLSHDQSQKIWLQAKAQGKAEVKAEINNKSKATQQKYKIKTSLIPLDIKSGPSHTWQYYAQKKNLYI